jgi:hypothetical protein
MCPYLGIEAAQVQHEINEGDVLPFLPDLQVIFTPGHSLGICGAARFYSRGMLLFLDWSLGYENFEKGQRSLKNCARMILTS